MQAGKVIEQFVNGLVSGLVSAMIAFALGIGVITRSAIFGIAMSVVGGCALFIMDSRFGETLHYRFTRKMRAATSISLIMLLAVWMTTGAWRNPEMIASIAAESPGLISPSPQLPKVNITAPMEPSAPRHSESVTGPGQAIGVPGDADVPPRSMRAESPALPDPGRPTKSSPEIVIDDLPAIPVKLVKLTKHPTVREARDEHVGRPTPQIFAILRPQPGSSIDNEGSSNDPRASEQSGASSDGGEAPAGDNPKKKLRPETDRALITATALDMYIDGYPCVRLIIQNLSDDEHVLQSIDIMTSLAAKEGPVLVTSRTAVEAEGLIYDSARIDVDVDGLQGAGAQVKLLSGFTIVPRQTESLVVRFVSTVNGRLERPIEFHQQLRITVNYLGAPSTPTGEIFF